MHSNTQRPNEPAVIPTDPEARITSAECRYLAGGISDMTLWRWIRRGIVPQPLVIERRRYWRRGEFLAALQAAGERGRLAQVSSGQGAN